MTFNYNTGFPCLSDVLSLWPLAGVELGGGGASWAGLLQEEGRGAGPGPAAGRWSVHDSVRRRCPLNWNGKQLPAVVILPGTGDLWRERPRRKPSTVSKKCELGCLGRRPSRRTQDWGVWAGGARCSEVAWEKRSCGHSEFTVESRARESAGPCPELTLGGLSGPRPRLHDSPKGREMSATQPAELGCGGPRSPLLLRGREADLQKRPPWRLCSRTLSRFFLFIPGVAQFPPRLSCGVSPESCQWEVE